MKKVAAILAAAIILSGGSAFATPSTTYWTPATGDIQPYGVWHLGIDNYFTLGKKAGKTGDLRLTIDYREVCEAVRGLLEAGPFHLVEAAARGVLDLVLAKFEVSRAVVRVRKFVLPQVGHVEVQMERRREI